MELIQEMETVPVFANNTVHKKQIGSILKMPSSETYTVRKEMKWGFRDTIRITVDRITTGKA